MRKQILVVLLLLSGWISLPAQSLPDRKETLKTIIKVNDYFMKKYADYTRPSYVGKFRPSNIWTRGVYYEGLMALHTIYPRSDYYDYAYDWADFLAMSKALKACQREDGFWNVSLHDESNYGGKETSGTSLFVYGMAWGIRNGILNKQEYLPVVLKAWNAIVKECIHPDGFLGYVQGSGKELKDSQPVTYKSVPDMPNIGILLPEGVSACPRLRGKTVWR